VISIWYAANEQAQARDQLGVGESRGMPFLPSRMSTSIDSSIKLYVCDSLSF
jgi:hypothetical protein